MQTAAREEHERVARKEPARAREMDEPIRVVVLPAEVRRRRVVPLRCALVMGGRRQQHVEQRAAELEMRRRTAGADDASVARLHDTPFRVEDRRRGTDGHQQRDIEVQQRTFDQHARRERPPAELDKRTAKIRGGPSADLEGRFVGRSRHVALDRVQPLGTDQRLGRRLIGDPLDRTRDRPEQPDNGDDRRDRGDPSHGSDGGLDQGRIRLSESSHNARYPQGAKRTKKHRLHNRRCVVNLRAASNPLPEEPPPPRALKPRALRRMSRRSRGAANAQFTTARSRPRSLDFFPHDSHIRPIRSRKADPPTSVEPLDSEEDEVVSQIFVSWNQMGAWLRQIDGLRNVA